MTKLDYVDALDPNEASVTVDNGSNTNYDALTSLSDSELGTTWLGEVAGHPIDGKGIASFSGHAAPLPPGFYTRGG